jgi:hypothetical protein
MENFHPPGSLPAASASAAGFDASTTAAIAPSDEDHPTISAAPPCHNILLLSSTLLLPTLLRSSTHPTLIPAFQFDYLPSSTLYLNTHLLAHKQRLLSLLSEWKEAQQRRGALLLSPLSLSLTTHSPYLSFFSHGETHPYPHSNEDTHHHHGGTLRYVLLSSLTSRSHSLLPFFSSSASHPLAALRLTSSLHNGNGNVHDDHLAAHLQPSSQALWQQFHHLAAVTPLSSYHQTGYLTIAISSSHPYTNSLNHGVEEIDYLLQFHDSTHNSNTTYSTNTATLHSQTQICLRVGPIIGPVTTSTVKILCVFFSSDPPSSRRSSSGSSTPLPISLFLVNVHTSQRHIAHQTHINNGAPCVFSFTSLTPNTLYVITLDPLISILSSTSSSFSRPGTPSPPPPLVNSPIGYFWTPSSGSTFQAQRRPQHQQQQQALNTHGLRLFQQITSDLRMKILSYQSHASPSATASTSGSGSGSFQNLSTIFKQIFLQEYTERIVLETLENTSKKMAMTQLQNSSVLTHTTTESLQRQQQQSQQQQEHVSSSSVAVTTSQSKIHRRFSSLGVTGGPPPPAAPSGHGHGGHGHSHGHGNDGHEGSPLRGLVNELLHVEQEETSFFFDTLPRLVVMIDHPSPPSSSSPSSLLLSTSQAIGTSQGPSEMCSSGLLSSLDSSDLTSEILEIMTLPFSGIELCVHLGNPVDLTQGGFTGSTGRGGGVIHEVLEVLNEIEKSEYGTLEMKKRILFSATAAAAEWTEEVGGGGRGSGGGFLETQRLYLLKRFRFAENLLRSLYQDQWSGYFSGGSSGSAGVSGGSGRRQQQYTSLYHHGSHVCCFNDVLTTLLSALQYSSLEQMRADHSEVPLPPSSLSSPPCSSSLSLPFAVLSGSSSFSS